ncbi:MAG: hypothetical protein J7M34_06935, partial [Anaerolineae bacterium]|nr:hypothetical protein [Anaerolineae bacterium]
QTCAECHVAYPEWKQDAHAQSAVNPRFLTMYEGTDVHGHRSPPTQFVGNGALPPDPNQPYYGPGFKLDYPDRAGNCASCHTPIAENAPLQSCAWSGCHTEQTAQFAQTALPRYPYRLRGIDPTGLTGVAAEGITCDFCHKIGDVVVDPHTRLPYTDQPGILSMRPYRPSKDHDLFLGTFDDVMGHDSYLPMQEQSVFCSSCHYGVFNAVDGKYGGVVIYNSYGEWLESPYSDSKTGKTCQDCHMPSGAHDYFVFPEKGGLHRDPSRIHNHHMRGVTDRDFMQHAVSMTTTAKILTGTLAVEVRITNDNTGHDIPTGDPLRHMLLVVTATDAAGKELPLLKGQVLPDWADDYAQKPGRFYAKILEDQWTGEVPTSAYWRPVRVVTDTRIVAMATDVSDYVFATPEKGPATVRAKLIYRRALPRLMRLKGWTDPDLVMKDETVVVEKP